MSILQDSSNIVETPPYETLFASRAWFERWLASFGGPRSGWWHPPGSTGLEFPYVLRTSRLGPVAVPVAWGAANSYTPRFDVCGTGTPTGEYFQMMLRELDVSVLVFPLLSRESRLARAVERPTRDLWLFRDFCESAPFVDCAGSWEAYLASRGSTRRRSWLSYERHATGAGMSVETLSSWSDIAPHFDQMLAVEASGWKGKLGSSIAQNPRLRNFYEEVCRDFAALGAIRVFLLWSEERIVAFQICAQHAGILTGLKSGYLEEFAKDSPGQVLHLHIVRWAFAQADVRIYDMLGPISPTKLKWATGVDELSTIYVFRRNLRGALARIRWAVAPRIKVWLRLPLGRIAARTGGDADAHRESRGDAPRTKTRR
ncbi:MAG: GNAT family N-acetyltransferase [Terriglobales bacterium]